MQKYAKLIYLEKNKYKNKYLAIILVQPYV